MSFDTHAEATKELIELVGDGFVVRDQQCLAEISRNTLSSPRKIQLCVRPGNQTEVAGVLAIARRHGLFIYTISTGKNWGYGGATPITDNCLLLDLSRLRSVVEFNHTLGYVTVEPGVTQADLYSYLCARDKSFMVPTTGAGPNVSILGNALERGYGITPYEDHFAAVLALKVLLPDGSIYRSALHELGGVFPDSVFKWKIGPYLDGLFTQSNYGIVLEATIALAQKPENVTQFVALINEEEFEDAVAGVGRIRQLLPGVVGGVNLMNKRRLLSILESEWTRDSAMSEIRVIELAGRRELADWAIVGAVYGPREITSGAIRRIKAELRPIARKFVSLDRRKFELGTRVLRYLPLSQMKIMLANAGRALEILEGKPSEVALPLAYLKSDTPPKASDFNPDRDDCGLIWFAPLLPIDPPIARDFTQEVSRICLYHNMEPLITMTAISDRCFDSTVPLLYSKRTPNALTQARVCHNDLLTSAVQMGLYPYRLDIDGMSILKDATGPAFHLAREIKKAIDPDGLLSPGRYSWLK